MEDEARVMILAPLQLHKDRTLAKELDLLLQKGYSRIYADGQVYFIEELLEEARMTGRTELACEFCGDRFHFDAEEMETLLADARASETGGG